MTAAELTGPVVPRPRDAAEWAGVIRADLGRSVQGVIDAGAHLAASKTDIPAGEWHAWLAAELHMTPRTAQRFMAIAANPVLANATHVSRLPASWGTLYELSRLPGKVLARAIEAGTVSPETTRQGVAALVPPKPASAPRSTGVPHAETSAETSTETATATDTSTETATGTETDTTTDGSDTAVDTTAAGGQEHESPQEAAGPPQAASGPPGPADPVNTAAKITVVPGGDPGGTPRAKRYFPAPEPPEGQDELAVAAGLLGAFGECRFCHGNRGLPVHADNRKTGVTGDMHACLACLPGARAGHPDVVFSFGHLQPVLAGLVTERDQLKARVAELEAEAGKLRAQQDGKPAHDELQDIA